jgi:hypothetical protein
MDVSSEGERKHKVIKVYLVHLAPNLSLILPTRVTLLSTFQTIAAFLKL